MMLIKIGGGEQINLEATIADLATLEQPFIIVHGANVLRDQLAQRLDIEKTVLTSVSGYSSVFSDQAALDVIMMSYSGLRNKQIVELCQRSGINAVGLTGLDGRLVQGERNKGIRVRENGKTMIKRDLSGKPRSINTALLTLLLENGYCPVLTIPIAAVVETEDAYHCWVKTAEGAKRRTLKLGDSNDVFVVVEQGVKEGDEVEARFTGIDRKNRVITLSVKAKDVHEEAEAVQSYKTDGESVASGTTLGDLLKEQMGGKDS
jgi:acetylglutamate kinase